MKDLLAKLDAYQVVTADSERVEFDNGMVVTYRIEKKLHRDVCLSMVITVRLGDGTYSDTAWNDEENRMILRWFNDKYGCFRDDAYDRVTNASEKLAKLIG